MGSKRPNAQRAAAARREAAKRRALVRRAVGAGVVVVVAGVVAVLLVSGGSDEPDAPAGGGDLVAAGGEVFQASCATCHGKDLRGTFVGPPLLHEIYLPDHHPDASIRAAVANGVTPHHWDFAAMPPIPLEDDEVEAVIAYIRAEQQAAGLGEDGVDDATDGDGTTTSSDP